MRTPARVLFPLSLLSAAIINTVPVHAQETALEEILVTAQRREQNLHQ